jgi:hypothetical protein
VKQKSAFFFLLILAHAFLYSDNQTYIFPDSPRKKLSESEIRQLPGNRIPYARNEIFARKGHVFSTAKYRNYFSQKSWYKPRKKIYIDDLNPVERYNVFFLKFYENDSRGTSLDVKKVDYPKYPKNKTVRLDLNGDGTLETVVFEKKFPHTYTLKINGNSIQGQGDYFLDSFAVTEIDKNDPYREIIISDLGPSDDHVSTFYYFDGKKPVKMGRIEGSFEYGVAIDGSGKFKALIRGDLLQTWFFYRNYRLDSRHKIQPVPQEIYSADYRVFLKESLKVFSERNILSASSVLEEGQIAKLTATDNKEWVQIEAQNGEKSSPLPGWPLLCGLRMEPESTKNE